MLAKQRATEAKGRVRITIPPLEGMPLLTMEDIERMTQEHFLGPTPPFRPPVKINGVKVEDMGTLEWALYVRPPTNHKWPITIPHPSENKQFYFYQLQSDYSKLHKLCGMCHQRRSDACRGICIRDRIQKGHQLKLAMPSRTSISFSQITTEDPTVFHALENAQRFLERSRAHRR